MNLASESGWRRGARPTCAAFGLAGRPTTRYGHARAMRRWPPISARRVSPFSSRYDAVLRGQAKWSPQEARGRRWFLDPAKGNCAACHEVAQRSKNPAEHLFTDFTYDSLGLPRNPAIPANADAAFFDLGLCGPARQRPEQLPASVCGGFRVPTLRNVAKRPFLFHNGSFTDLAESVRFYVQRDTNPARWFPRDAGGRVQRFNDLPMAQRKHVNRDEAPYDRQSGQRPRLSEREISDLVAFLKTLDDGFRP
jgi:cytochrome c peroxidase